MHYGPLQAPASAIRRACSLRVESTKAERLLWEYLQNRRFHGIKFRRQVPIGPFIADFVCAKANMIIEADGGIHSEPEQMKKDRERSMYLEERGFRVVRFSNREILENTDDVLSCLAKMLDIKLE